MNTVTDTLITWLTQSHSVLIITVLIILPPTLNAGRKGTRFYNTSTP